MDTEVRISSFPPVVSESSQILVLGSVPGVKSLEMQEYYAHPQNAFWKIMFQIFDEEFTSDYNEKLKILHKTGVALWDVIDSCERKGSLDSEIKNEEANRIEDLLKSFPNIKAIFCNGRKSFKNLEKILGKNPPVPVHLLPSTSPLHTISLEKKVEQWKIIKQLLT